MGETPDARKRVTYPYPLLLERHFIAQLRLPADLTANEAARIGRFVLSLVGGQEENNG